MRDRHVVATGFAVGLDSLTNFEFRPDKPFRACLICGAIFQKTLDRLYPESLLAADERKQWAVKHAKQHPQHLHEQLRLSGNFALPEAAQRLQAFGIFSLNDLVLDNEVAHALATAPRAPQDDARDH
jgi:hypothetical protein